MKSFLSIAIVGMLLTNAANAGVVITGNTARASVDGSGGLNVDTATDTTVPALTLAQAANGVSTSDVQVDYRLISGQTVLKHSLQQTRGGGIGDLARGEGDSLFSL